ncbi:type I glyceraldehyde-3-phosphate dehydrogenase [Candidatus Berkelbacteria bacterium CG10_big_fil_rev_8_21_14_0_10_43_13]|uniref:Glyceraldehyde-3-phosphate dehydrogenase n=1 Tax=Candidatus Berkelbacteria bacterium CG10_big_fil_rev_8_21_14_0_10_43_13 TaxID=1974514 RepID=A0A2H0W795_9BACT|nr:MAG: type I glyceraldehyde-3-phosphate dehydrogenase [Candidatus Berkelbacteria bacterium CG10_big_fil_rev_8_21_14_0_10_43_13]
MKLAINGFGRIGRAALKIAFEKTDINIVAINDLTDTETLAHLLKYDSVYRIWEHEVGFDENDLIIDKKTIHCYAEKDPAKLPWRELGVDVVLECTGRFLTSELSEAHIKAGAKKVVMSAPAKDDTTPTYVMGVNSDKYKGEKIISNASCTTNCITPVMKVLQDNFGIEKSLMTTIHSYTADQNLIDGSHKDLRRARAAALNIVPTSTGAAKATALTIPELKNKFDGLSIRVPSSVVSLSDIVAVLKKKTDLKEIEKVFREAEEGDMAGILATTDEPVVSTDMVGNKNSSIVDLPLTQLIDGDLVKIIAWYDNEWGYSERLVDLAKFISK